MLARLSSEISENLKIKFTKETKGEDASIFGAFPRSSSIKLSLSIPRALGVLLPYLRIEKDGEWTKEFPLSFKKTERNEDIFSLTLDASFLCGSAPSGLFYYDFVLSRGKDAPLFTSTEDNLSISFSEREGRKFRLLIYEDSFEAPEWFKGGIMYHIFVDRFSKGSFNPICREDAEMNYDWENGIPQYAEYPGAPLKNNQFFGGNLVGIKEKLDYLSELGVSVIYLSPIFKAYSNHKYDTGDYMQVDEMFGGDKAFEELLAEAKKHGIRIILDGVFNHTGDDSKYFNKYGKYTSVGAYNSPDSEYYNWYHFGSHRDEYQSWWGIGILPKLNLGFAPCRDYFVEGEDSVIGKYIKMGIGGIRLDVADELSDDFLDRLRATAKKYSNGEAVVIGEVWENAADKISYGYRRRYLQGAQLDSVMNYPFRSGAIEYLTRGEASILANALTELYSSYPKCVSDSLMNILGTHDTERIITILGGENLYGKSNHELAHVRLSEDAKKRGASLLKLGSILQYTVYGVPSVFYGDEAGLEGAGDPFCRRPYPWGKENGNLVTHYKKLGSIRKSEKLLKDGYFRIVRAEGAYLEFERYDESSSITVAVNVGNGSVNPLLCGYDLLSEKQITKSDPLPPWSAFIIKKA